MDWVLVVTILWAGQLASIQVPVSTKDLCFDALRAAVAGLSLDRAHNAPPTGAAITAACLRVR